MWLVVVATDELCGSRPGLVGAALSDFRQAFDEQVARERAQEERRAERVRQGRANIEAFIQLMSEHEIAAASLRGNLTASLAAEELVQSIREGRGRPPADSARNGWTARFIDDNPKYRVSHYIMEDGRVIETGVEGTTREPRYVSEEALADAEALAAQAMAIIRSRDPHHGEQGRGRPA